MAAPRPVFGALTGRGVNDLERERINKLGPTYMAGFRQGQAQLNKFFAYHREGESLSPRKPWEDPNAPGPYIPPPNGRPWDGWYSLDVASALQKQVAKRYRFADMVKGRTRKSDDANKGARAVRRFLRGQGADVSLLKILGFGGNGVATLFDVDQGASRTRKKVVVKALLRTKPGSNMKGETSVNQSLKRARHTIQMLTWEHELMGAINAQVQSDQGRDKSKQSWAAIDDNNDMLTLEFMKNGDMWGFIKKVAWAGETVPNKILWRIFFCLIRACISMKYPPRLVTCFDGDYSWESLIGPDLAESIPEPPSRDVELAMLDLVHFDLDPQNVLIGGVDNNEHRTSPIFKVSDFGLASATAAAHFSDPKKAWMKRKAGKVSFLIPEQFHKEWEYINLLPQTERQKPKVAGQYGEGSNVWAIALCMHVMITQAGPPYPPAAIGPLNHPDGDHLFLTPTRFNNKRGDRVRPFYTHGYSLQVVPGLDPELKCLLMRCLADLPADRPTLEELREWTKSRENQMFWNSMDPTVEWCRKIFQNAPAAPTSAGSAHPSLATTQPPTPPPPAEVSVEMGRGKSSRSGSPSLFSSDEEEDGGIVVSRQAS